MLIDAVSLEEALVVLGQLLKDRGVSFEVVAIGGGSLLLLGQIERPTKDLDLVAQVDNGLLISIDPMPGALRLAAKEVGLALNLGDDWLNPGPASLLKMGLPQGFEERMQMRCYGSLTVHLADRFDQICFKLYAAVDQGPQSKHFMDLKQLLPTYESISLKSFHELSDNFRSKSIN